MDAQTVREFVGDIEQESERPARITENLLRLTRLDSGMLPEAQRVDLSSVMARVVRMLRLVAEEKQVDLSYEIRREGQTLASEDEIHEIIYNLTENAIKYNRPGGFVKLLLAGDEKDCLLTVSDNGIGIPEGGHAPHFRPLLPRGQDALARRGRYRPWPFHRRRHGAPPRRQYRGPRPRGRRHGVYRAPAALQRGRG